MAPLPESVTKSLEETKAEYRLLGKSGLRISVPVFGCMSIGNPQWADWVVGPEKALPLLKAAYDRGINTVSWPLLAACSLPCLAPLPPPVFSCVGQLSSCLRSITSWDAVGHGKHLLEWRLGTGDRPSDQKVQPPSAQAHHHDQGMELCGRGAVPCVSHT